MRVRRTALEPTGWGVMVRDLERTKREEERQKQEEKRRAQQEERGAMSAAQRGQLHRPAASKKQAKMKKKKKNAGGEADEKSSDSLPQSHATSPSTDQAKGKLHRQTKKQKGKKSRIQISAEHLQVVAKLHEDEQTWNKKRWLGVPLRKATKKDFGGSGAGRACN